MSLQPAPFSPETREIARRYRSVRRFTEELCEPLAPEDCVVQSMPDVSPTKWHIGHVTWFFETFLLSPHLDGYRSSWPEYRYLFNSYYNGIGEQFPRPQRGLLTRPLLSEVMRYRREVDEAMARLLEQSPEPRLLELVELGLNHEQQHQELLLMDIKHVLSCNPLHPAYGERKASPTGATAAPLRWAPLEAGLRSLGHDGDGFSFDNERPQHRVWVPEFELATRPITNGEYLDFVEDGGYRRHEHWLADGWDRIREEGITAPLYWVRRDDAWYEFTLYGLEPLDRRAPVCHVSYFEADAFARWSGARLPTEAEWESAASGLPVEGRFVEGGVLHPQAAPATSAGAPSQLFGDVWEWTASPYAPYPGFQAENGALGEYNGKFMCNQFVMRGGACITSREHVRGTYRNFFYPHCRWQLGGFRLAR